MTEEQRDKINEGMAKAVAILQQLAIDYNFHYGLNFAAYNNGNEMVGNGVFYNEALKSGTITHFIEQLHNVQEKQSSIIPNMLQLGYTIVMCLDNDRKPKDWTGDWLTKDQLYVVMNTRKMANGEYCYVLKGMMPAAPYDGYICSRFIRIITQSKFN